LKKQTLPTVLIIGLSVTFFFIDLAIPLGVAGGIPHIIPILLSYKLKDKKAISFFAILGSAFTILAYFLSPPGGEVWMVLTNRFLALFAIWVVAIACQKNRNEKEKLYILNDALNQSPNPVAITDKAGSFEYVNPAFIQKTGYSKKELIGKNPRILKSGKHSEDFYRVMWETITSGKIWEGNIFNKRKNGTLYWESLQISPLKNSQGEITDFFSLRLLDKQMKVTNKDLNKLNHTLDQIPQAVLMTDRKGFIVYANPAFEEVTGYSLKEVVGMNPNVLKSEAQTSEFFKKLWGAITTGKSWTGKLMNKKKNGELYWERSVISPVYNDENKITHFIALREDITEEQQKTDKLNKLSLIVDGSPISIIITDFSGNIEYVNQKLLETSGYSLSEVMGKNPSMFQSGDTPKSHYQNLWNRITAGHDWRGVFRNKKKNGELYWESVLITPYTDEDGNITNYVALKEDISEKKQLESTLIDHERLIRSVVNNLKEGLIIANMDGNIQLFNKGAEAIFGYKVEEVMNKPLGILMNESNKKRHDIGFARFKEKGKITPSNTMAEVEGLKKDGTPVPIELTLTQMKQREELLVVGMVRDISERKKAEKQRRENEVQLAMVTEAAEIYSWDWQINTDEVLHDPRWIEFLGYSKEEFKNTLSQCKELIHPDDFPNFKNQLDAHLNASTEIFEVEYRVLKKSGEWIWTLDKGKVLERDEDGKPLRAYGTFQNIQKRKEAEEKIAKVHMQLAAAEKLAGVGELAAGVSHEVLNPVNIISVHTQILQRKMKDDPNIQIFSDKIKHEVDRIQKIMSALLAFSRKGDTEITKGNLVNEIEKTLALVEEEYKLDNINIIRRWCDNYTEVFFDADKMRQVYLNLIHNAKHAMPDGGTITVDCRSAKETGKNFHQFTFSDTGMGMSEETKMKIFEPFFTTKPEGEGTGMGLSVIHGIIKEHGGKIRVESEKGKGTTFIISLPVA
jgi:two-component system sensor histidine kinase/response regulator